MPLKSCLVITKSPPSSNLSPVEFGPVGMEGLIPFPGSKAVVWTGDAGSQSPAPQHPPVLVLLHHPSLKRQQADGEQGNRMQHTQIKKSQMW